MTKYFVLDTNVLLHNRDAIHSFGDNVVVLPMMVVVELDRFKKREGELGHNTRSVIRELDKYREKGNLTNGVEMESGGTILTVFCEEVDNLGVEFGNNKADNVIIATALQLQKENKNVIFISKDINARLRADALGISVQDFEKQKVNIDDLHLGYKELFVPSKTIKQFYDNDKLLKNGFDLSPNEFALFTNEADPKNTALGMVDGEDNIRRLNGEHDSAWGLPTRNVQQRMVLELLLDPKIEIVTIIGQAGTGKTLLALAAGLDQTTRKKYGKVLVFRPIIPMGKDLGFMPGDKEEKLECWMQPIKDNLKELCRIRFEKNGIIQSDLGTPQGLIESGLVKYEALTYVRGSSICQRFIIVDEAQNLTPHEAKTMLTRAGEGTKIVLTGDPDQIDNPYLDAESNGLTHTAVRLKHHPIHGHLALEKTVRSNLAGVAAELL